jgi:protein SCO1/2/putative membrane protein
LLFGSVAVAQVSADDDLGTVADFALTERGGQTVRATDLAGKVWVASFIFTRCAGPCFQVSSTMARLQQELGEREGVLQVSFTVDPDFDTPKVLQEYARRFGAGPTRWLFLSGSRSELYDLIRNSFHLGVERGEKPEAGYEVEHSTKLVLVDGRGRIRGYYDGTNPDELPELIKKIDVLQPSLLPWQKRLPAFNALLNGVSALLLACGFVAIRRRWVLLHKACMLSALLVSGLFLASYLYYHLVIKQGEPTRFTGVGGVRIVYFGILLSHTVLAAIVAPLALFTAYQGLRDRLARHVWIARWTLPLWLYVSVTGVVVYWMLYHLYPSP